MSVPLNSCVLTTACLARKDPFPISGSYFCSPRMCFWSCLPCIMYYSKYNISRCQCSFWTKLSVLQKKLVTATAEKYWTLFSKIRILSKCAALGLAWYGLTWSSLERCTDICTWAVWAALDSLCFPGFFWNLVTVCSEKFTLVVRILQFTKCVLARGKLKLYFYIHYPHGCERQATQAVKRIIFYPRLFRIVAAIILVADKVTREEPETVV